MSYSDLFKLVIPSTNVSEDGSGPDCPPQIQDMLESAMLRQRNIIQSEILDFTRKKQEELRLWRDRARRQARTIASLARQPSKNPPVIAPTNAAVSINVLNPKMASSNSELFQKSPVTHYTQPEASPLAAASLTRDYYDRAATPSPPPKVTPPPIPLSSSLKSPGSANFSKPVKRVMFQEPPDVEEQSDADDDAEIQKPSIPYLAPMEPTISVDGN